MSLLFLALELLAVLTALLALRLPGGGSPGDLTEAQLDARRRVGKALDALGGLGSPAGSCVWHVVGLQRSIREWALRQGWGGRPVRVEQAQGDPGSGAGGAGGVLRVQEKLMTNRLWTQQRMCGHANRPQTHATGVWLRGLSVGAAIGVDR